MRNLTRIWGKVGFNKPIGNHYFFSKNQSKKHKNPNYEHMQQQQHKELQLQEEQPFKIVKFDHNLMFRNLVMVNMTFAMGLPFTESINAGILLVNGGYMLGQLGHQLKQFLIYMGNKHYQHLKQFRKPSQYLRLILQNMLVLSVASVSLAFSHYYLVHLITMGWFALNIHRNILPSQFMYMTFVLLFIIFFNYLSPVIKKLIDSDPTNINTIKK